MRNSYSSRFSPILSIALVFAITGGAVQSKADNAASGIRDTALQSCPAVPEEIVDLDDLAAGLKASKAVGMLDKIRLKSGIDDLLKRMRAYHKGKRTYSLEELQEQYDVLLMKIAGYLQDKDVTLHGQLCNAWESLWLDLEDPERFAERFA